MINYMSNGKFMMVRLIAGLEKKDFSVILSYKMSQYFPKPYEPSGGGINLENQTIKYFTCQYFKFCIKNKIQLV